METELKPLLRCRSAALKFNGVPVLRPFDFEAFDADVVAISGPSGAGKTSFLRLAAGLLAPTQGTVERAPGLRVGFAFQSPRLLPWRKAWENIAIPLINDGAPTREAERTARALLAEMEIEQAADLWPGSLSGGMAQRVALARALAIRPDMLLLDEPLNGLDNAAKQCTLQVVKRHIAEWRPVVLHVTHSTWEIMLYATRFLCCKNGALIETERNENIKSAETHEA